MSLYDAFYLHSNMDRLKPGHAYVKQKPARYLHSNMDRLKRAPAASEVRLSAIYIPIWID